MADFFQDRYFPGGLTYSGHPLAMAAIVATLDAMAEEQVVENAERIGNEVLGPGLAALAAKYPLIGEVRGLGVFWAVELVSDAAKRTPLAAEVMGKIKTALIAAGLLPFVVDNRIHVVPPCVITQEEVVQVIEALVGALGALTA